MFHKIISVTAKNPVNGRDKTDVLLTIVRDGDEGQDSVRISAWHRDETGEPFFQAETINFPRFEAMERFIEDYSEESAQDFVDYFEFQPFLRARLYRVRRERKGEYE